MTHAADAELIEDIYPLTPMQQGMLFYTLSAPESGVYLLQTTYTLQGDLDVDAFGRAWTRLIERHAILRTAFLWEDLAEPMQVVFRQVDLPITQADWRGLTDSEQRERLAALLAADQARGFDLAQAPLMRLMLIRLAQDTYHFVWSRHHLLLDGWSIALVLKEFFLFYEALRSGRTLTLPPPRPFRDYVAWLQRQNLAKAEAFWRDLLRGFDAPTILRVDQAPSSVFTGEGRFEEQALSLSAGTTAALEAWTRQHPITLNTLVQGVWAILLSRYSGEPDVVFGATVFGRPPAVAGVESIVGLFVNALPVRARVPNEGRVLPWLRDLQARLAAARDYEYSPLAQVQAWSDVPRGQPLFETDVAFENYPVDTSSLTLEGLKIHDAYTYDRTNYALTLFVLPGPELLLRMAYDSARFDRSTVARLLGHVRTLLEAILANPEQRLGELSLVSPEERHQLLVDWNSTHSDYPRAACLPRLFEAQVERTPEAAAVVCGDRQLTYRQLDERANQLAHCLQKLGVGPEVRVGVYLERSLEMVVGLWGILKAGGAYVPLDLAYPRARLAFMLRDTQAPILLTQQHLLDGGLPEYAGRVICLDTQWAEVDRESRAAPASGASPESLAYLIYTSGSTGLPKGVMVTHRGLVNYLHWCGQAYAVSEGRGAPVHSSLAFDLTITSLFSPLLAGRPVHLLAEREAGPALAEALLAGEAWSLVKITPAHLELLNRQVPPAAAAGRTRAFVIGGDALRAESLKFWRTNSPATRLINEYGPTETVVGCCTFEVPTGTRLSGAVPIGRPIANTRLYALDPAGYSLLPVGLPGELFVGGEGVARGYLNAPDLTAERFIPDPYSTEPGARLYRTGDLVRYLPDGNLDYLGRLDQQVKIRGYRIEPGEIEAVLAEHPAVREAVVIAPRVEAAEAHAPQRRLAAYVTVDPGADGPSLKTDLEIEQVSHWQQVFENEVRDFNPAAAGLDATFNTAGWNSSYDGQPLPAEAMREWLDQTVARILALRPRRVLEIGCGTGLQLFRIAPHCERYWGTDFAGAALAYVQAQLAAHDALRPKVRLLHRRADDFTDLEPAAFDLVILNSVAQYFPSLEYVLNVLEKAARVVAPGGCLFIGDVRSLPLLEAFHTWAALAQAPADMSAARLKQRIRRRIQQEVELVIAPAFFTALRRRIPRVTGVQSQLKRGQHLNELTQFRYDVVLQLDGPAAQAGEADRTLVWGDEGATLDGLPQVLGGAGPERVRLTGVPNARLLGAVRALDLLKGPDGLERVGDVRAALQALDPGPAVDPEAMWALGERHGCHTVVSWSGGGADGCFEVVFQRGGGPEVAPSLTTPSTASDERPWQAYANHPWQEKLAGRLGPELRRHLKERLPAYMVPASLTFLETLPLTPNGKVDHEALPPPDTAWMESEVGFVSPRTPVEQTLAEVWQQVLGLEQVGVHHNFFELGGDSIHSIQVVARAHQAGLRLTPRQLFQYPTVAGLAAVVEPVTAAPAEQHLVLGAVLLTPVQRWFFEQDLPEPQHWNQALLFEARLRLDPEKLAQALFHLLSHHDALRLRFTRVDPDGWQQDQIGPDDLVPVSVEDLSGVPAEARTIRIEGRAAEVQASLNLTEGPLLRLVYFDCGPAAPGRLLWVVHHLAIDGVSWRVLLEDWHAAYSQLERGQAVALPPKTTSFKQWAEALAAYAHSEALRREAAYWLSQPYARVPRLPVDLSDGLNREESAETTVVSLDAETTRALLREVPAAYHTQIDDVLLTALAQAVERWTGKPHLLVDLEGHGREDIFEGVDVSRTVGWFTTIYPVVLGASARPGEALKAVKEQLRQVPHRGLGYGVLRYLSSDAGLAAALCGLPQAEMSFNYLGQLDQALPPALGLGLAAEASGPARSGRGRRRYLLAMGGSVTNGQLHLGCTYSRDSHHTATIRGLMEDWLDCLRALIAHCLSPEAGGYTPSDFPYAGLSQADLDDLLTDMNEVDA